MKVLYLTKYSRLGASSRMRSYQYFPFLEENGIEVTVRPLFDDDYLRTLYTKQKQSPFKILQYYLKRILVLFTVFKYDKVVIEKELFPYFFSWFEKLLWLFKIKYIVDYDDAIFHNYDLSPNKLIRFFLRNKINRVMKYSHTVVAGNSYLAARASQANSKNIKIIPTVIDVAKYKVKANYEVEKAVIGWIGSPSTFQYIETLMPILEQLIEKYNCELHIVGAKNSDTKYASNIKFIPWSEERETDLIATFDIGIMPLKNTPWELGKCSYKLIQYMGCGLPVVASPVGMNREVVEENGNGFFADSNDEWFATLSKLLEDAVLRKQLGEKGRQKAVQLYSLHFASPQLLKILN